ncbi:hypothetical protein AB9P05_03935 [Roseivirga sp. BDSF3-8]|uniref:hypothetical protein n=1 Tax=Roseivirga sp. BDSF3-8 TaxID=3241598 RepID=UPI0035322A97
MKRSCLLLALLFISFFHAGAQESETGQATEIKPLKVLLPTPEIASLGKFGNTPVNYYSGSPNFSIPIFTIEGMEMNYPITLAYTGAGGIRVEEMATWVGLGWTLQGQGVISRTVVGKPDFGKYDDSGTGYLGYLESKQALQNYRDGYNAGPWSATEYHDFELDVMQGNRYETQPDYFSYNINGMAGKIILDGDGTTVYARETPRADLQITTDPGATWRWTIVAPDGTQYFFEAADATKRREEGENVLAGDYHSGWNLSKIISPNYQDIYTFEYETIDYEYDEVNFDKSQADRMAYSYTTGSEQGMRDYGKIINTNGSSGSATVSNTKKYLKAIYLNGVKVAGFELSSLRADMATTGRRLESVTLYDKVNGMPLRKQEFTYSYFGEGKADPKEKRLRLDKVQERGLLPTRTDGYNDNFDSKPPHTFTYHSRELPARDSNGQDHWGYYNGKPDDQSLLPVYTIGDLTMRGGDRNASFSHGLAAVLKKVTYPTGGYTEFTYEPHSIDTENEKQYVYDDVIWGNSYVDGGEDAANCDAKITAIIDAEGDGLLMACPAYLIYPFTVNHDQEVEIISSGIESRAEYRYGILSRTDQVGVMDPIEVYSAGYYNKVSLEAGTYELVVLNGKSDTKFKVAVHGKIKSLKVPDALSSIGGLRIKSIKDYSQPGSAEPITREFSYIKEQTPEEGQLPASEVSSGKLMYKPDYVYLSISNILNKGSIDISKPPVETIKYVNRTAQGVYGMSVVGGSHIGYSRVTEQQKNPVTGEYLGSKVYHYRNSRNTSGGGFPVVPSSNGNESNGRLEKDEIFDNEGNRLASTDYYYRVVSGISQYGLNVGPGENREYYFCYDGTSYVKYDITQYNLTPSCADGSSPSKVYTNVHLKNSYSLTAHTSYLDSVIVKEYDAATGAITLEEVKYHYYDNPAHLKPTRIRLSDSKGQAFEIRRKYPADYAPGAGMGLATLDAQHKLYTEIESQVFAERDEEWYLIDGKATTYGVYNGTSEGLPVTIALPDAIYTASMPASGILEYYVVNNRIPYEGPMAQEEVGLETPEAFYEKQVDYVRYDAQFNIAEAVTDDGIDHYFLYGYNKQYPVAEVTNYQGGAVVYSSFEEPANRADDQAKTGGSVLALLSGGYQVLPGGIQAGQEGKYVIRYFYKATLQEDWEEKYVVRNYVAGDVPVLPESSGYIDELRFAKEGAMFTTNTFYPGIGTRDATGEDGVVTYYDYDRLGRLYLERDHNREIIKRYYYRYAGQDSWNASLESDTEAATIGQSINYYVLSDKPVSRYDWTIRHMGQTYTSYGNTSSVDFTPTGCGDIYVEVRLTNNTGQLKELALTTRGDISGIVPVIDGPATAEAGQTATYTASVPEDCAHFTYQWSVSEDGGATEYVVGEGSSVTLQVPCDDFIITVTATTADGREVVASTTVTVDTDPLQVQIGGNNQFIYGQDNAYSSVVNGGCPGYAYHWEYQDEAGVWQDGGHGPAMVLPGACREDFSIRLTVTDRQNTSVTIHRYILGIEGPGVTILHDGQDPNVCKGDYVYFQGYGVPACDAAIVSYQWYSGSGSTKTIINGATGNKLYIKDVNHATLVVTDELGRTGEGVVSFSWNCENTSPDPCPDTTGEHPCFDNGDFGQQ